MSVFGLITRTPGELTFRFRTVAAQLQSPSDMDARQAFDSIVLDVLAEHGVQSYDALPRDVLRMLDRCLVLVHKDVPTFLRALVAAGVSEQSMVNLRIQAEADPDCVRRVQVARAQRTAEEHASRDGRVEIPDNDLVAWMSTQPRGVWHEVATGYNWDAPAKVLGWIVRQPDCDLATALDVFLKGAPDDFVFRESVAELNRHQREIFDLLDTIVHRIQTNDYRTGDFGVDPSLKTWWCDLVTLRRPDMRRWDFPLTVFDSLKNGPTNAPFTFHDGEIRRSATRH